MPGAPMPKECGMKYTLSLAFALCLLALGLVTASGAAAKSAVVLPFAVNAPQSYSYLSKAVPATIQGRLNQPGVLDARAGQAKAASQAEGPPGPCRLRGGRGCLGFGERDGQPVHSHGQQRGQGRQDLEQDRQGPVSSLTATVQQLTAALGQEAFGVAAVRTPGMTAAGGPAPRGDILVNETGQQQVYLNPQFRYQGAGAADGSRLRSQRLPYSMVDMAVADFNGDGKNEIAVLSDHNLRIYSWQADGKLKLLGETSISRSNVCFSMRAIDLDRDRAAELVVSTFEEDSNRPYSYIYTFKGNKLRQFAERVPYFMSVVRLPPTYTPTLVGQGWDSIKLFAPGVHIMVKSGGKYTLGTRIDVPSGATPFNIGLAARRPPEQGRPARHADGYRKAQSFSGPRQQPYPHHHGALFRLRHGYGPLQGHARPGRGQKLPAAQQILRAHAPYRRRHRQYRRICAAGQQAHFHGFTDL